MSDIIESNAGIPAFLRKKIEEDYGREAERILRGSLLKRPVTLRANALRAEAGEVEHALKELAIPVVRTPWYEDAMIAEGVREEELEATSLYREGKIYLQSLSSMLPPLLVAPLAGESVLDMTAAPGGKTAQLAALSGGKALITACERDRIRFERLKFNLARQGVTRVNAMQTDALRLDEFFRFDKILLDAPCSGSGTRNAVKATEKLLSYCVKAQGALLKKGLKLLKKGGRLVYSTCSVLKAENEEIVRDALKEGGELVPIDEKFQAHFPRLAGEAGTLTVCPDLLFEGFFVAVIQK